jgi:predicted nucleic acid-binding protein
MHKSVPANAGPGPQQGEISVAAHVAAEKRRIIRERHAAVSHGRRAVRMIDARLRHAAPSERERLHIVRDVVVRRLERAEKLAGAFTHDPGLAAQDRAIVATMRHRGADRVKATHRSRPSARRRGAGRPRAQAARSSVRSGDSGDDGPGEPPAAHPALAGASLDLAAL